MRVLKIDPINGEEVKNIYAPFVVEGFGDEALKIYFTSDENRQLYLDTETLRLGGRAAGM